MSCARYIRPACGHAYRPYAATIVRPAICVRAAQTGEFVTSSNRWNLAFEIEWTANCSIIDKLYSPYGSNSKYNNTIGNDLTKKRKEKKKKTNKHTDKWHVLI